MFLPIATDAPLYHRPWGTLGLIVCNCITFWMTGYGGITDGWVMRSGHFAPTEWITSAFFHVGFLHLLGNMLFLWMFGMIVEGKLGLWKFLSLYLALCLVDGFANQLVMLGEAGRSAAGASGVIYSLMAIALVWAPRNEIEVIMIWFIGIVGRPVHEFRITVFWFAMWYIGSDLFFSVLLDFALSTPVLHALGAIIGFPVGALMVKRGWVDCEGWDLFSVRRGIPGDDEGLESLKFRGTPEVLARQIDAEARRCRKPERERREIQHLILSGKFTTAWSRHAELRRMFPAMYLDEVPLRRLIDGLHQHEEWTVVVQLLAEYIERFPTRVGRARLMQAGILVRHLNRPRAAIRALDLLQRHSLALGQQQYASAIRKLAHRQIAEGVIELSELTPLA